MNNREKFLIGECILQSLKDNTIDNETLNIINKSKLDDYIKLACVLNLKYLDNDIVREILENVAIDYPIHCLLHAISKGIEKKYIISLIKINNLRIINNFVKAYTSGMSDMQLKKLISYSNENESDEFLWRWEYKKLVNHYDEIKNWDWWSRQFIERISLKDNIDEKVLDVIVSLYSRGSTTRMEEYVIAYEDGMDQENLNKLAKIKDDVLVREFRIAVKNNMDDKNLNRLLSLSGEKTVQFMRAYDLNMDEKNLETLIKLPTWHHMKIFVEAVAQDVGQEYLDILSEINNVIFMETCLYNITQEGINKNELKEAKNMIDNDPECDQTKLYDFFQKCKMNKKIIEINQYIEDNNLNIDINTIKELLKI